MLDGHQEQEDIKKKKSKKSDSSIAVSQSLCVSTSSITVTNVPQEYETLTGKVQWTNSEEQTQDFCTILKILYEAAVTQMQRTPDVTASQKEVPRRVANTDKN